MPVAPDPEPEAGPAADPGPVDLPASWGEAPRPDYDLRLYVSGATPLSARAIVNIRRLCEARLPGRYALEIVDISQHPRRVADDQVTATPTLLRLAPLPVRRLIGDLSQTARVLAALGLEPVA